MAVRIALSSDLHHEVNRGSTMAFPTPQDVDVAILAGDIGSKTHGMRYAKLAHADWPGQPPVVYVLGNHEYYHAHLGLLVEARRLSQGQVHLLEQNVLELSGLRILGCTLWSGFDLYGMDKVESSMAAAGKYINDFHLIRASGRFLQPKDIRALYLKSVAWLDAELTRPFDGKTVVVTHFAPHRGCIDPKYDVGDALTPYFVNNLAWLMEKHRIDAWCFGHTHYNVDFIAEGGCRIISNQQGYPGEPTGFRPNWALDI